MSDIISKAASFAAVAHGRVDQRRKYTFEPYIIHPFHVAQLVAGTGARDDVVAAAWLHDVVEDTPVTIDEVRQAFNEDIAALVSMVTNVSRKSDGHRAVRKIIDQQHLAKASAEGMTIKVADILHNTQTIVMYDKAFASVYLPEKERLLEVLQKADADLLKKARQQIKKDIISLQAMERVKFNFSE